MTSSIKLEKLIILAILVPLCYTQNTFTVSSNGLQYRGVYHARPEGMYTMFRKIPYAQDPSTSQLRFRDPAPYQPLGRVIDATGDFSAKCPQQPFDETTMNEDCLYLNIFTKKNNATQTDRLPVLFWIHGGAFHSGSASEFQPEGIFKNLVSRDIVVVTINYRLGPFGYFTLYSPIAEGNYGLKDQIMALRWVKNNIQAFGGDPSLITVAGESAGAASTSMLAAMPLTSGLFQRAILMSGSMDADWAMKPNTLPENMRQLDASMQMASTLGCAQNALAGNRDTFRSRNTNGLHRSIVQCLRQKRTTKEIMQAAQNLEDAIPWAPRKPTGYDFSNWIRQSGVQNLMIGTTSDEWGMFELVEVPEVGSGPTKSYDEFVKKLPLFLPGANALLNELVKFQYLDMPMKQIQNRNEITPLFFTNQSVQMQSALYFWAPAVKEALEYSKSKRGNVNRSVHMYEWSYVPNGALASSPWKGAIHASELPFVFGDLQGNPNPSNPWQSIVTPQYYTEDDGKVSELMGILWTNFVKFGNPDQFDNIIRWDPFDAEKTNYLDINGVVPTMRNGYNSADVTFWNQLVFSALGAAQKMCYEPGKN